MSYQESDSYNEENIKRHRKHHLGGTMLSAPDRVLLITVTFLVIIGFMAIFSASAPKCIEDGGNPAQFLIKQIICFVVGFIGLRFFINHDYRKLADWNVIFIGTIIVLLVLVDFTPLGVTVNGAKRWINLLGFHLQPSEFAKPAVILMLAYIFKNNADLFDNNKWTTAFIPIILILGLVFIQPNLSMVILLLATGVVMFLCAGGSLKLFFSMMGAMIFSIVVAATTIIKPYQMQRIVTWQHPELDPQGAGYNIIQSLIAFATGGLTGVGYGGSIQKLSYLPECHTDFIFAIIAEELGFIGCAVVIVLFGIMIWRGMVIAMKAPDMFGRLTAAGITSMIALQVFINIAVVTNTIPVTGMSLPLFSYGGSSLIIILASLGILLNISRQTNKS
jgi:cell division protein FtsW